MTPPVLVYFCVLKRIRSIPHLLMKGGHLYFNTACPVVGSIPGNGPHDSIRGDGARMFVPWWLGPARQPPPACWWAALFGYSLYHTFFFIIVPDYRRRHWRRDPAVVAGLFGDPRADA